MKPVVYEEFELNKQNLANELDRYRGLVVTDMKQSKGIRASLNKLAKVINDYKKERKRDYINALKPLDDEAKELIDMVNEVKTPIDAQIKQIEMAEQLKRESKIKQLISDMAFSYQIDPDKVEIKAKWLTKSISDIELKREIGEALKLMNQFDVGKLPDGINKQAGKFINDDGEIVYKYSLEIYATDDDLDLIVGTLDMDGIHYKQSKEGK